MSILDNVLSRDRHLDDAALALLWAAGSEGTGHAVQETHLTSCAECRGRFAEFSEWVVEMRDDAVAEADEAFPPERLAAQQAHIFRRLEALERPARVIAFPRFTQPASAARRGPQRWTAAGVAAGLMLGLAAGQILDLSRAVERARTNGPRVTTTVTAVTQPERSAIQPASLSSDDAFLYDAEAAITSPRVEALQALDALTPRVRDIDQSR